MKFYFILFAVLILHTNCFSADSAPSMWAVRAEKLGVSGKAFIKFNKDFPPQNQPLFEGWIDDVNVKKETFHLSSVEIKTKNQNVNLKEYAESYKLNKLNNSSEDIVLEKYNFIKLNLSSRSLVIDIKDIDKNVIVSSWNGKNVYLKIPELITSSSFELSYNHLFGSPDKKEEIQKKIKELPSLEAFIKEMHACTLKKDKNCIIEKVALNKEGEERERQQKRVDSNFIRKFVLDDPKICEIYEKTRNSEEEFDNHIPAGIDKKIDYSKSKLWISLQEAFDLNLNSTFVNLESSRFANGIDSVIFFRKITGKLNCSNHLDLRVEIVKTNKGWSIDMLELTSFDADLM